ncbi:MAG: hypothetical protein NC324_09225 [Bacteroides sp.]|nr:hypothetical protein [Bacteroides sp.]
MANNINKLLMYRNVLDIVNEHYEEGVTTYSGVWRMHVYQKYPMSYQTFMKIVNLSNLESRIRQCGRPPASARISDRQLSLFG